MKIKQLTYLIFGIVLLTLVQCKEDEVFSEVSRTTGGAEISGTVMYDTDGDDVGDEPIENVLVFYGDLDSTFVANCCDTSNLASGILWTLTDAIGHYSFSGLAPADDKKLYCGRVGMDASPDGDEATDRSDFIGVSVSEDEHDSDNNFVERKYLTAISGYVMADTNGDLIGDVPHQNVRIDLVTRGSLPYSSFRDNMIIESAYTDDQGYYEMNYNYPGTYLLRIQEDGFNCEKTLDESPDDSEDIERLDMVYLQVDLDQDERDTDNNFVINTAMEACDLGHPEIRPVFPSAVCSSPEWNIACYFGNTRLNPNYDEWYAFVWTSKNGTNFNLTPTTSASDSDTVTLQLMLPNGCTYELTYIEEC